MYRAEEGASVSLSERASYSGPIAKAMPMAANANCDDSTPAVAAAADGASNICAKRVQTFRSRLFKKKVKALS